MAAHQPTTNLELEISEFRNTKGHVLISVFDREEGYPESVEQALVTKKVKVTEKSHHITLENLPYGDYAIVFLHDENGNGKMDTNFVGMPTEGYGASNDAVNTLSAPKYKDAQFKLAATTQKLKLKIFY